MAKEMTRKDFQEIVNRVAGFSYVKDDVEEISISWSIGGQSGASCYDVGDPSFHATSGEPEPEFDALDNILMEVTPQLSFLQYKKLAQLVSTDEKQDGDYYGNYTTYATKTLKIDDLWDFLTQYDLV